MGGMGDFGPEVEACLGALISHTGPLVAAEVAFFLSFRHNWVGN